MPSRRSRIDRRSNINRRVMELNVNQDRREGERRDPEERRQEWVRTSKWSSMDLALRNEYYWDMLNPDH